MATPRWLVALLSVGGVLGNLLPGDLGRGTHHQLPHPHHQDHHHPGHHAADHHHTGHTHGKKLGHHSTDHNHGEHTNQGKHKNGARRGRQDGEDFVGQLIDFSSAVEDPSTGLKCVLEEATVDTFEKEQLLTCTHSMIQVCHYTYVTQFRPHRVEECSEYYEKTCSIVFSEKATNETVRKCYKPVEKVCNGQGPEECRTVYESSCTTKYVEKQPGKFVEDTGCERLPVEICGAGCVFEEGVEECHDKVLTSLVDVPEEHCDLNPQKICKFVTKLVPKLAPKHE